MGLLNNILIGYAIFTKVEGEIRINTKNELFIMLIFAF